MYKPDLDEGWFKLAHGMLPALLAARFRIDAVIVLSEVLAQVYGRGKRPYATLDIPDIARRWGIQRPNAWRGLAELKRDKVLTEVSGVAVNVKFHKHALLDLLPPNVAQGVANYSMLVKLYEPHDPQVLTVSTVDTPSEDSDGSTVSTVDTQTVSTVDTQTVSEVDTVSGVPPDPPIRKEIRRLEMCVSAPGDGTVVSPTSNGQVSPDTHTPDRSATKPGSPPPRTGEDAARFEAAVDLLMTTQDTEAVGLRLSGNAHATDVRAIDGWRFLVAARVVTGSAVPANKRRSFAYFREVARNADPADLDGPGPRSTGRAAPKPDLYPREVYRAKGYRRGAAKADEPEEGQS